MTGYRRRILPSEQTSVGRCCTNVHLWFNDLLRHDAKTLAPLGYLSTSSSGGFLQLTIDEKQVRGKRRQFARAKSKNANAMVR